MQGILCLTYIMWKSYEIKLLASTFQFQYESEEQQNTILGAPGNPCKPLWSSGLMKCLQSKSKLFKEQSLINKTLPTTHCL